jgi:hypothetical protein
VSYEKDRVVKCKLYKKITYQEAAVKEFLPKQNCFEIVDIFDEASNKSEEEFIDWYRQNDEKIKNTIHRVREGLPYLKYIKNSRRTNFGKLDAYRWGRTIYEFYKEEKDICLFIRIDKKICDIFGIRANSRSTTLISKFPEENCINITDLQQFLHRLIRTLESPKAIYRVNSKFLN